jgi:hypothetical protein
MHHPPDVWRKAIEIVNNGRQMASVHPKKDQARIAPSPISAHGSNEL